MNFVYPGLIIIPLSFFVWLRLSFRQPSDFPAQASTDLPPAGQPQPAVSPARGRWRKEQVEGQSGGYPQRGQQPGGGVIVDGDHGTREFHASAESQGGSLHQ